MDSYLTADDARDLAGDLPQTSDITALLALDDAALLMRLVLASVDIDAERWQGRKYDPRPGAQPLEFPRVPYAPPPTISGPGIGIAIGVGGAIIGSVEGTIWDWDPDANEGQGAAIVPQKVELACLYQAASYGTSQNKRLEKIRSGLKAQAIGTGSEQYASLAELAAAGLSGGLCERSARLLDGYRLRTGRIL